jgi:hypothetical protein
MPVVTLPDGDRFQRDDQVLLARGPGGQPPGPVATWRPRPARGCEGDLRRVVGTRSVWFARYARFAGTGAADSGFGPGTSVPNGVPVLVSNGLGPGTGPGRRGTRPGPARPGNPHRGSSPARSARAAPAAVAPGTPARGRHPARPTRQAGPRPARVREQPVLCSRATARSDEIYLSNMIAKNILKQDATRRRVEVSNAARHPAALQSRGAAEILDRHDEGFKLLAGTVDRRAGPPRAAAARSAHAQEP